MKRVKKEICIGMILLLVIISLGFISSYASSNVQFSQYQPSPGLFYGPSSLEFEDSMCQEGQDFLIQIAPFGCTPAVVRSDLLEEQNVPVFCQLAATKINPLIQVDAIESLSFSGEYPPEVAGVGFEPTRSALGGEGVLNRPTILDNIGYAVVVLKKQENESAMPDFVEGNLSVKIKYDIKNAFGIGQASFYLPILTDDDWEERKNQYSFWNGKGFLRAEDIEGNRAKIVLYDGQGNVYRNVVLEEGETSEKIYLPGFYCLSSLDLKLEDLEAPDTRALLKIDESYFEVKDDGSFLEGRCQVTDLYEAGILDKVTIRCKEDEADGWFKSNSYSLAVSPKINLSVSGVGEREYGVGDLLYTYQEPGSAKTNYVYLGYVGTVGNTGLTEDLKIAIIDIPLSIRSRVPGEKLDEPSLNYISRLVRAYEFNPSDPSKAVLEAGEFAFGALSNAFTFISTGRSVQFVYYDGKVESFSQDKSPSEGENTFGDRTVKIIGFSEPVDVNLDLSILEETQNYYELAKKDFDTVLENYPLEKDVNGETFENRTFVELINLNSALGQKRKVATLCDEYEQKFGNSKNIPGCQEKAISNSELDTILITVNGRTRVVSLEGIYEPSLEEYSAEITIQGPNRKTETATMGNNRIIYLDDFRGIPGEVINLGSIGSEEISYTPGVERRRAGSLYVSFVQNQWQYSLGASEGWKDVSLAEGEQLLFNVQKDVLSELIGKNFDDGNMFLIISSGYSYEFIELLDLEKDSARVRIRVIDAALSEKARPPRTVELKLNEMQGIGDYLFTLNKVNLQEEALVSVNPGIDNTGSEANLSFKVGIEKRAIQLSPGKIKTMIGNLNDSIEKWNDTSERLGKVVKGLKTACLAGGALLVVKNFLANVGGKSIARQSVMRGEDGWRERCANLIANKTYLDFDACYADNANKIENWVNTVYKHQQDQEPKLESWQEQSGAVQEGGFLGEDTLNDNKYMSLAIGESKKDLVDSNGEILIPNPENPSEKVDMSGILTYETYERQRTFTPEQLREIQLNRMIMNDADADPELRKLAEERYNSQLQGIYSASQEYQRIQALSNEYDVPFEDAVRIPEENLNYVAYTGRTGKDFGISGHEDSPAQLITSSKGSYIVVLDRGADGNYGIAGQFPGEVQTTFYQPPLVYDAKTKQLISNVPQDFQKIVFQKKDESSYKNKGFKNPSINYYETEPYKGLPAIVPINTQDGWYAAVKQTLPGSSAISAYDKSGRISSFYLCHVGENSLQEFRSGIGDDTCQMINLGTGMAYNQFPGLSKSEAEKYIKCGIDAIEQASRAYTSSGRTVKISTACGTVSVKVGEPAVNIPDIQCQDFMSPSDCLILYNLCDPVICPSSRCDLGGTYPVRDVIQTGIIGGFVMCLPNIKEKIYIPLCLTGIQAGIDGYVSVLVNRRDCLQEQLDTGKTIGICDELESVYMCELFWRQALPFAEVAIPKLIGALIGAGEVRGGGEYLGVQSAWDSASKSFTFFTQQYAQNSFAAFRSRSIADVGTEICRSQISGVVPNMDFVDQFTEPDSPSQFHARFDEIPFTTVTSPPISQYKVFYHIYAGKDSAAYYQVYLKGSPESTYFRDTSSSRIVAQGYIAAGDIATETRDFTAPSGYKELCVVVNGQEECGFKQVSTSLALNYVREQYVAEQAGATDIKTEQECISGSASAYSLLNPNIQEGVAGVVSPSVYDYGLTRVCSTDNPGKGTDPNAGGENSRWVEVGNCGDPNIKCWTDTSKIKDITQFRTTQDQLLSTLGNNTLTLLKGTDDYVDDTLDSEVIAIENVMAENKEKAINKINELIGNVFLNSNKARLYLLRGRIYSQIAKEYYDNAMWEFTQNKILEEVELEDQEETEEEETSTEGAVLFDEEENLLGEETGGELAEEERLSQFFDEEEIEIIRKGVCEDCGLGIFNFCDERECLAIGDYNDSNDCVFIPTTKVGIGDCIPESLEMPVEEFETIEGPKSILDRIRNANTCTSAMDITFTADYSVSSIEEYKDVFEMATAITCLQYGKSDNAKTYLEQVNKDNLLEEYFREDYYYYGSIIYYLEEEYTNSKGFVDELKRINLGLGQYGEFSKSFSDFIPKRINFVNGAITEPVMKGAYNEILPKISNQILRNKLNQEFNEI